MKFITTILLAILVSQVYGQEVQGTYKDYFGYSVKVNSDSTFMYEWNFDLVHIWSTGKWTISDKIIHLEFIEIYDTLRRNIKPDSLVLSIDSKSSIIEEKEYISGFLIGGGQSNNGFCNRLKVKHKKLYVVKENGHIERKRIKGIWSKKRFLLGYKKWPTYYKKIE